MTKYWKEKIKPNWITNNIDKDAVDFAERFGTYLAMAGDEAFVDDNLTKQKTNKRGVVKRNILTTNQLRRFFGEVKKQQSHGYDKADFMLLKPKLAYAVGKAKDEDGKIHDFYYVLSDAISIVNSEKEFKNFIKLFEAIVAYHKATEESKLVTEMED